MCVCRKQEPLTVPFFMFRHLDGNVLLPPLLPCLLLLLLLLLLFLLLLLLFLPLLLFVAVEPTKIPPIFFSLFVSIQREKKSRKDLKGFEKKLSILQLPWQAKIWEYSASPHHPKKCPFFLAFFLLSFFVVLSPPLAFVLFWCQNEIRSVSWCQWKKSSSSSLQCREKVFFCPNPVFSGGF